SWYANEKYHENIMGWYGDYIIPIGALLIGVVASSGYGIASWFSGVRIHRWLLALILFLGLFAYFAAHYIEFRSQGPLVPRDTGAPVTFPEYFHAMTITMAWKSESKPPSSYRLPGMGPQQQEEEPETLGKWGYLVRLGELVGFVGGSLIAPAILLAHPY